MKISQVAIAKAQTSIDVHQAALDVAKAEMATAQWRLEPHRDRGAGQRRRSPTSPCAPGDTATVNIPMIGIVDADAWRIMANYKQYYIRSFEVGGTAWVWLDSAPWHFHRARITGIARGFSRDPQAPMLLPYVAPTTDWIRLQRRIPVTIVLVDPPPDGKLYMGADARTVIFPRWRHLPMTRKFTRAVIEDFAEIGRHDRRRRSRAIGRSSASWARIRRARGRASSRPARCMLATTLALVLEVEFAVVGGDQRLHVADGDRRRLAAPRHAAPHRNDRRRAAGLRHGALAALRPFRALPVPRRGVPCWA